MHKFFGSNLAGQPREERGVGCRLIDFVSDPERRREFCRRRFSSSCAWGSPCHEEGPCRKEQALPQGAGSVALSYDGAGAGSSRHLTDPGCAIAVLAAGGCGAAETEAAAAPAPAASSAAGGPRRKRFSGSTPQPAFAVGSGSVFSRRRGRRRQRRWAASTASTAATSHSFGPPA